MKKFFLCVLVVIFIQTSLAAAAVMPPPIPENESAGDHYFLIYMANEYNSKLGDSVKYFFKNILKPEDQLSMITPIKPYGFTSQTRQKQPLDKLVDMAKKVLKKDISMASAGYRQIQTAMQQLVMEISGGGDSSSAGGLSAGGGASTGLKTLLVRYRQLLEELRVQRRISEKTFMNFAGYFSRQKGNKYIYLIFQKEVRIIPDRNTMDALRQNAKIRFDVIELFEQPSDEAFMNEEKVSGALKAAGVTVQFLYWKPKERRRQGMQFDEYSSDIYGALSKLARATGGNVIATSKPEAAMKKISKK
ncbi:MAG: hypothetical protein GY950_01110 [bacterium]|nr:hypothetical protein [bacterium]